METAERIVLRRGELTFSGLAMGTGPAVLCLHGFPDDAQSFREQLPAFAAAGYRTVSMSLRGYEPGSQPDDGDYSLDAVAGDVAAWVDELDLGPVHFVGHDWGAAVAYVAGAQYPDRFRSLTAMAVPHAGRFVNETIRFPRQLGRSWYMGFFQLRGIAERAVRRRDFALIRRLWRSWSPGWNMPASAQRSVLETFAAPGVVEAALGYYRAALAPRAFTPKVRAAARFQVRVPTLAITGERDGCIGPDVFEALTYDGDFAAGVEVRRVDSAGHFLHQERPAALNALLLDWFERHAECNTAAHKGEGR